MMSKYKEVRQTRLQEQAQAKQPKVAKNFAEDAEEEKKDADGDV